VFELRLALFWRLFFRCRHIQVCIPHRLIVTACTLSIRNYSIPFTPCLHIATLVLSHQLFFTFFILIGQNLILTLKRRVLLLSHLQLLHHIRLLPLLIGQLLLFLSPFLSLARLLDPRKVILVFYAIVQLFHLDQLLIGELH
jgi:hypothetical protein